MYPLGREFSYPSGNYCYDSLSEQDDNEETDGEYCFSLEDSDDGVDEEDVYDPDDDIEEVFDLGPKDDGGIEDDPGGMPMGDGDLQDNENQLLRSNNSIGPPPSEISESTNEQNRVYGNEIPPKPKQHQDRILPPGYNHPIVPPTSVPAQINEPSRISNQTDISRSVRQPDVEDLNVGRMGDPGNRLPSPIRIGMIEDVINAVLELKYVHQELIELFNDVFMRVSKGEVLEGNESVQIRQNEEKEARDVDKIKELLRNLCRFLIGPNKDARYYEKPEGEIFGGLSGGNRGGRVGGKGRNKEKSPLLSIKINRNGKNVTIGTLFHEKKNDVGFFVYEMFLRYRMFLKVNPEYANGKNMNKRNYIQFQEILNEYRKLFVAAKEVMRNEIMKDNIEKELIESLNYFNTTKSKSTEVRGGSMYYLFHYDFKEIGDFFYEIRVSEDVPINAKNGTDYQKVDDFIMNYGSNDPRKEKLKNLLDKHRVHRSTMTFGHVYACMFKCSVSKSFLDRMTGKIIESFKRSLKKRKHDQKDDEYEPARKKQKVE